MAGKRSDGVGELDGVKNCVNRTRGQCEGQWSLGQSGHGQQDSPSPRGGVDAESPEENRHSVGSSKGNVQVVK